MSLRHGVCEFGASSRRRTGCGYADARRYHDFAAAQWLRATYRVVAPA